MENMPIVFLVMISVAVFLLVWNLMVPVFGQSASLQNA